MSDALVIGGHAVLDVPRPIDPYHERGFFVVSAGLTDAELQHLRDRVDALIAKPPEPADPARRPRLEPNQPRFGYLYDVAYKDQAFESLVRDPRLVDLVAPLMPGPRLSLYTSKVVFKPPGSRQHVPLHQDYPNAPDEQVKPEIWFALDDADEDNGCLRVVPGSHRAGRVAHRESPVEYMSLEVVEHDRFLAESVPVPVKAGDAVVFCTRLIHGSLAPTSDRPRRAFVLAYQATENPKPPRGWPIVVRERAGA